MPDIINYVPGTLLLASFALWIVIAQRIRNGTPILVYRERRDGPINLAAICVAGLWIAMATVNRLQADFGPALEAKVPSVAQIHFVCMTNAFVVAVLVVLLNWNSASDSTAITDWQSDMRDGALGMLAAIAPVLLILWATLPWRSEDTQHAFLKLLRDQPTADVIAWIAIAVLIAAPVAEELLYRVVLQGALRARFSAGVSIATSSTLFCIVHGWRDGMALLPLAVVLGYVYDRRNSLLAIVVTHSLFNAWNLLMVFVAESIGK